MTRVFTILIPTQVSEAEKNRQIVRVNVKTEGLMPRGVHIYISRILRNPLRRSTLTTCKRLQLK